MIHGAAELRRKTRRDKKAEGTRKAQLGGEDDDEARRVTRAEEVREEEN